MARYHKSILCLASLALPLVACSSAYADRIGPPAHTEKALAKAPVKSPYDIDLIGENGEPLEIYQQRGRFYVLGMAGQRYTVRVSNPTDRRVEAVISVDGLDVIDGRSADLGKRGYVVPAHGELRVDGFRVSTQQVATFRFSSVSNSYAGRKGKARNVGVIGVAIFEEREAPQIITPIARPEPPVDRFRHRGGGDKKADNRRYDLDDDATAGEAEAAPAADPPSPGWGIRGGSGKASRAPRTTARRPAVDVGGSAGAPAPVREHRTTRHCCTKRPKERPGLGTEFGERRGSAVSWTRFVRANPTRPDAMAELRYNDASGLQALGIQISPVDPTEIDIRETATPFPGSRFAEPPR